MTELMRDLRFAVRSMLRAPAFAVVVVTTLALGIGANTALFSVVRSVLLAPLPYAEPDRVAMIWSSWTGFEKTWVSVTEYHNYRANARSFEELALFQQFETSITEGDEPERVGATAMSQNLLAALGVRPLIGRGFEDAEVQPNGPPAALISYEQWQRRYAADPGVLGRTLQLNGNAVTIVGVLPNGFRLPLDYRTDRPTQIWVPYVLPAPSGAVTQNGGSHGSYAIGRLRSGVTVAQANAELAGLVAQLEAAGIYPPQWNFAATAVSATDEVAGLLKPALLVLLGAVGFVLLIACANVANLVLVRGEDRRRELSVRTALGADRARLVRQLFAENAVLALAGGALGVGLAWAGIRVLAGLAPVDLPRVPDATIDGRVLGFTLLLSLATAALFGLVPALHAARTDIQAVLREGGRANTAAAARHRVRRTLVAGEVALAVVLAAGAGLMVRSFWQLLAIDPGFRAENVLTMRLSTPAAFYPADADVTRFYTDLLRRVRALPGVQTAGLIRVLPIDQTIGDSCVQVEGYTPPPGECTPADWQAASDGYFEALDIPLVEGRFIAAGDTRDAPQVMVVNEEFVRRYIADGRPLGKAVRFAFQDTLPGQTIVGVVADARHNGITGEIKATFYRPHAQWSRSTGNPQRALSLVVRAARDAGGLMAPVRAEIRALDPRLPVSSVQLMDDVLSRAVAQPRFTVVLLLGFGALALALAIVGIYGVVSYAVAARRQELGIRMALGAAPRSVVWLSLRHGLTFAVGGVIAGTAAAVVASRLLRNLVYGVPTTDPLTYAAVAAIALGSAFLASWIPARRAARADPLTALRSE
jgi:predicted permease